MRSIKDPRHIARVISIMDLYKHFFSEEMDSSIFDLEDLELGNFSTKIREEVVKGVKEKYKEIDELINKHSDPIKTTDIDYLLLQILRIAIYEGFISKSIPPKVAVDEAIELSRDFGMELSTRKVSGILGKIFEKTVKPEEKKDEVAEKKD